MSLPPHRISHRSAIVGAVAFLLGAIQFFIAQIVAATAWKSPYSWSRNWISDLGNTTCGPFAVPHGSSSYVCSPLHVVMNASFVASGLLFLVGVIALWKLWPDGSLARVGKVLLLLSGALKPLVGLAPENTNVGVHLLGALNLPLASIGILLVSLAIRPVRGGLGIFGVAMASLGLVGTVLSSASQYAGEAVTLGLGYGGMERVADYPAFAWMVVVAVDVLLDASRTSPQDGSRARRGDARAVAAPTSDLP